MFIKLSVLILFFHVATAQRENQDWELAVVTDDRIELLLSNGSLAGEPYGSFNEFTKLKALTFDSVRHQFVVSDMDQQNDTIFTVQLTKETDIVPIIEDLPDDVQGLTIDPITDILYWTDSINRTINYVRLNDSSYQTNILFAFSEESPQDITIDVCHQFVYWTNSDVNRPTIERAKLDGTQREVLVETGLHSPAGIAIDYTTQRLLWSDIKEGIYYSIESTNLEGQERQVIYEGTHSTPFGITVDGKAIYWTDINNNILWAISKDDKEQVPRAIRRFKDKPMGIIAKNVQITSLPDCQQLSEAISASRTREEYKMEVNSELEQDSGVCLNGGYLEEGRCRCLRGYAGEWCEVSLCHNYCLHGQCYTSSLGYPKCHCLKGFAGDRCERSACDGYCFNGGKCSHPQNKGAFLRCSCPEGFSGVRCEVAPSICDAFCRRQPNDVLMSESEVVCRCVDGVAEVRSNFSSLPLIGRESEFLQDHLQDTAFLVLCCLILAMLVAFVALATYTCSLRRRPRIKKRIIVNKNVTPLTYRPQPTSEQCEITIENCCNMNICETPCFEPPKLQCLQGNDDKKKLLSNMENGEDLY